MSVNDDIQQALNAYEAHESILKLADKWGEANEKLLQAAKDILGCSGVSDSESYLAGGKLEKAAAELATAVAEVERIAAEDKKDRA